MYISLQSISLQSTTAAAVAKLKARLRVSMGASAGTGDPPLQ